MTPATSLESALTSGAWLDWPVDKKRRVLEKLREKRSQLVRSRWQPYPWQRPHVHPEGWEGANGGPWCTPACLDLPVYRPRAHDVVMLFGGRGIGKTDYGAQHVLDHVNGPACDPRVPGGHRLTIVAPTIGDAVESCVNGPSGLRAYDPRVKVVGTREGTLARFPNGARARLLGASSPEDVNRLRSAGNACLIWIEEAAACRHLAGVLDISSPGLRLGHAPHYVVTTTPRARPEVKALLKRAVVTQGRTEDAHHLPAEVREALYRQHAGTRIGRQELDGVLLDDVEGALWKLWMIDDYRIDPRTTELPALSRVVVGVDPNAGGPDECGIVAVAVARDPQPDKLGYLVQHSYVLEDRSDRFANPGEWADAAVRLYRKWSADVIVGEVNNGGDMVPHTIRTVDPNVPVRSVTATRGKVRRAEPVVALYEQGRVHHYGAFSKLEDQQTSWTEADNYSPDRMDALVWALTEAATGASSASGMFAAV